MMLSLTTSAPSSASNQDVIMMLPKFLHSRRLLFPIFHYPLSPASTSATAHNSPSAEAPYYSPPKITTTFDTNVVMVLSVLLCALICSLVINAIIRSVLRCTSRSSLTVTTTTSANSPTNNFSKLANTGIKKKALKAFTILTYSSDPLKLITGLGGECVICISEFATGEKVRLLPRCNHGFHVRCIDKWLNSHSSCPTCRNCLIETCDKIVLVATNNGGMDQQSALSSSIVLLLPQPTQSLPPQHTVVDMIVLEREGPARNLRVT